MSYCTYTYLSGGLKTFRTLKLNVESAMPSVSSILHNVSKDKPTITEGQLRHLELFKYLEALKVDKYVSLSEDATNITGMVEYSPKSNQIIGLLPPLNDDTGMPIPYLFAATSATAMESILTDPKIPIAHVVNVVMAQPLALKTPAFCLLVYGGTSRFSKDSVALRWAFISKELEKVGIKVINFASDSDPRYNGAMRDLILRNRASESSTFPSWFQFDCSSADYLPFQDHVHIGTKLRNRLLDDKNDMWIGKYSISKDHLITLMDRVTIDKHGLSQSHIKNNDKMNFLSVLKISKPEVIELLQRHVKNSAGTVMYLNIIDKVLRAFLDFSLTPLERIQNMFYAVFILRMWKKFTDENPNQNGENFITIYTYVCIEVNAHSLVSVIRYLRTMRLQHLFLPHLYSSQPCESFFREFRALSSVGSTFTCSSVLGMIQRCERIALMNELSRITLKKFTFVTDSKRSREYYYNSNRTGYTMNELPSDEEIIRGIELVKQRAVSDALELGVEMDLEFDFGCDIQPTKPSKAKVPILSSERKDGTRLTKFNALSLKNFASIIDFEKFDEASTYVAVDDVGPDGNERRIYVRKSALCKLYVGHCTKMSSDRQHRVKQRPQPNIDLPRPSGPISDESSDESSDETNDNFESEIVEYYSDGSSDEFSETELPESDLTESFSLLGFDN